MGSPVQKRFQSLAHTTEYITVKKTVFLFSWEDLNPSWKSCLIFWGVLGRKTHLRQFLFSIYQQQKKMKMKNFEIFEKFNNNYYSYIFCFISLVIQFDGWLFSCFWILCFFIILLYLSAFCALDYWSSYYCIALLRKKRYNMPRKHEVNPTQV